MNFLKVKPYIFDVLALMALGAIIIGSFLPPPDNPAPQTNDKILHFGAYGALTFLAVLSRISLRDICVAVAAAILIGIAIEFLQPLAGRDNSAGDMLANTAGALLGGVAAMIARRVMPGLFVKRS